MDKSIFDSEDEFTEDHSKLIKSLEETLADGDKHKRKNNVGRWNRIEAAGEIDEFNVPSRVARSTITLDDVLDRMNQSDDDEVDDVDKKKKKKKSQKSNRPKLAQNVKTLIKPVEKPVANKIQRTLIYDNVKKDISKWNSVVYHNRTADQLVFPLSASKKLPRKTTKDAASEFVPETLLEEEMARILHGEEFVKKKKAEIHEKDVLKTDAETYVMGIEEALERHHEMARLRALQSYEQIKSKRQSKIKSKKYHRLLRREKIRKQLKEFEQLQKTDPEAALAKLEELDKSRITERMSLKHRNTSKWAKMQSARAKYDRESRSVLSDQLKISRELTKKVVMDSSEDEDVDVAVDLPSLVKSSLTNPWILDPSVKDNEKLHLYYTGYKKFWQEVNEIKQKEKEKQSVTKDKEKMVIVGKEKEKTVDKYVRTAVAVPDGENLEESILPVKRAKLKNRNKSKKKASTVGVVKTKNFMKKNEEVTLDVLDEIMDAAEEKIKSKAGKELEKFDREVKNKRKRSERKVKAKKPKTNRKGDADEIRDLNVDESEKNNEGDDSDSEEAKKQGNVASVDLVSERNKEVSNFGQKLRQSPNPNPKAPKIIDPENFLRIGKSPTFDMGAMNENDLMLNDEQSDSDDAEEERLRVIAEAFEDDDLLEEFKRQKQEEVESQLPKEVDTTLPGWGEWGGQDIKPNQKKRKMFTLRAPPPAPRRDARVSHVILNDGANSKLRDHQVRSLPFPFKRVQDFEKMIRAPVGRTWLPEQAMKSLTAPKIITRLGAAIQPISEDVLVSKAELNPKKPQLTGLKLLPAVARRKSAKLK